jgi:hypothetical protein
MKRSADRIRTAHVVGWATLKVLAEGAALASGQLWGEPAPA